MASKAKRRSAQPTRSPGILERGKLWIIGGGAIGAIALLFSLTLALSGPRVTGGEPAPDISLATVSGDFRLSENQGEVLLLYFSFPG